MKRFRFPTRVTPPPPLVPICRVANSRIWLSSPITSWVSSPAYFKSCGTAPTEAKWNTRFRWRTTLGQRNRVFHGSYRSEVEHPISLAERGPPVDHRVSANPAFCADSNLGTDNRVGADLDGLVELRLGVHDRGGMDLTHRIGLLESIENPGRQWSPETQLPRPSPARPRRCLCASKSRPCAAAPPRQAAGDPRARPDGETSPCRSPSGR